jgi:putative peptidoglycan lipid II flippase
MATGLAITVAGGAFAVGPWGACGIAAANAAGISVAALLLLHGLAARMIPINVPRLLARLARLATAAVAAVAAGWAGSSLVPSPLAAVALGCLLVPAAFAAAVLALRLLEATPPVFAVKRRLNP